MTTTESDFRIPPRAQSLLDTAEEWGMVIEQSQPEGTLARWVVSRPCADRIESRLLITLTPGKRKQDRLDLAIFDPIEDDHPYLRIAMNDVDHWLAILAGEG